MPYHTALKRESCVGGIKRLRCHCVKSDLRKVSAGACSGGKPGVRGA